MTVLGTLSSATLLSPLDFLISKLVTAFPITGKALGLVAGLVDVLGEPVVWGTMFTLDVTTATGIGMALGFTRVLAGDLGAVCTCTIIGVDILGSGDLAVVKGAEVLLL